MAGATVTYEEWLLMPEVTDATEEVVNGEIRITPPQKWVHARTVEKVSRPLIRQLDQRQFYVFTSRFGLIIRKAPLTCRVPDLAVFEESTIVEEDGFVRSAPQLVAEVLSPDERIEEKLADYASLGLPEVWVISPEARTVEVLYLEDGHLCSTRVVADGTLTPRLFPHVTVEIASLWFD